MAARIVTLTPSATEIVVALGLGDRLVGVTHECDHPTWVGALPRVTRTFLPPDADSRTIDGMVRDRLAGGSASAGTAASGEGVASSATVATRTEPALYELRAGELRRLAPDLVISQSLCDVCAVAESAVEAVAATLPRRPAVVTLSPQRLDDLYESVRQVGNAAGVPGRAETVAAGLRARVERLRTITSRAERRPRVLMLEWADPPFGAGHWSPELIDAAGGDEVIGRAGRRSRVLEPAEVVAARPEVVLLALCGFGVGRAMEDVAVLRSKPWWTELPAVQTGRVLVMDGSTYFNRPGPRLVEGAELLAHALHPELVPSPPAFAGGTGTVMRWA